LLQNKVIVSSDNEHKKHYQSSRNSCRLETVGKSSKTVRKHIPVGQPSRINRQEQLDRKDHFFLAVDLQESFPDGSPDGQPKNSPGLKYWPNPDGIRKPTTES